MKRAIIELLFSPRSTCLGCGSVRCTDKAWLCADCYAAVAPLFASGAQEALICRNCGEEYISGRCRVCNRKNIETLRTCAAYEYDGPIRQLVHTFKFRGAWRVSEWMAEEMKKACTDEFLDGVTLVVPVPMHRLKKLVRGYNQTEKLALAFSKITELPYKAALKKSKNTCQQVKLTAEKRRKNLVDAFTAREKLEGETVLLIDDVRTTGSTVSECARTLLAAGAKEVRALTFSKARTYRKPYKKYRPDRGKTLIKPEKDPF